MSSKLIARLRQDYPKHEYVNRFEAAIPAYSVQMIFEVLQKQDLPPVPARTTGRFFFNALAESIVFPGEELKYPDQLQGLFVLPPKEEGKPNLSKFIENEKDVKSVLKDEPAFKDWQNCAREGNHHHMGPESLFTLFPTLWKLVPQACDTWPGEYRLLA
jgi:hypothetical protein